MSRRLFALSALLLALAPACRGGSGGSAAGTASPAVTVTAGASASGDAGCAPGLPHAAGRFDQSITSGGLNRTYILHVPPGYDGSKRAPLLLSFHGFALTAKFFADYDGFDALSDTSGFIVVTPDGSGSPQFWNAWKAPGAADDVQFVRDLLDSVGGELCIDPARVYADGYSNGGAMALRIACEMPDRIAAVGVAAAVYVDCRAAVPLIAFHGTSDPIVAFEGFAGAPGAAALPPVRRAASEWARTLGCDGLPTISRLSGEVELSTFHRCLKGDAEALLYTVLGGGHTWPGARPLPENIVGATTQQIDASSLMWGFFAAHPKTD